MPQDHNARFQEILSKLPPDKKKELYVRMRSLPAEGREAFIKDFVQKYDAHRKPAKAPKKQERPAPKPAREKVKPTKAAQSPKKQEPPKKEKPEEHKPEKAAEKKSPQSPLLSKIIVAVLIVLLGMGAIAITAINNREDITKLLRTIKGETEATVTETTENEYKIAASLAVQTEGSTETTETTTPAPTPTPIVIKDDAPDLTGLVIVIDPGHQAETDETEESLFPGSTVGKARCTSGAVGVDINTKEYEVTLDVALVTKAYLEECGASVILTRDTNDINLSNQERANLAVAASPDIYIRLHADAAPDSEISGVMVYVPDSGSYVDTDIKLADKLGALVAEAQGTEYLGCISTNAYTGLNYASSVKEVQLVMGFLSNSEDEARLNDPDNYYEIAAAIAEFCNEL